MLVNLFFRYFGVGMPVSTIRRIDLSAFNYEIAATNLMSTHAAWLTIQDLERRILQLYSHNAIIASC